jgi:hypothetical protein
MSLRRVTATARGFAASLNLDADGSNGFQIDGGQLATIPVAR